MICRVIRWCDSEEVALVKEIDIVKKTKEKLASIRMGILRLEREIEIERNVERMLLDLLPSDSSEDQLELNPVKAEKAPAVKPKDTN